MISPRLRLDLQVIPFPSDSLARMLFAFRITHAYPVSCPARPPSFDQPN